jgi:hypothetical protein
VTHSGLTRQLWQELGSPGTAEEAAGLLNDLLSTDRYRAFAPGRLLQGQPNRKPGVVWASAGDELYPSWAGHRCPFGQVQGHTSAYDWDRGSWADEVPASLVGTAKLDFARRHLRCQVGGATFYGTGPGFCGRRPGRPIMPMLFRAKLGVV